MEKTDTTICLKKKNKRLKEYQKNYREAKKSQYIIIKQFFNYDLTKYATQLYIIKSLYLCRLDRLIKIKAQ